MKFKVSKRDVKEDYYYIIGTGYCTLQTLLRLENPISYSSGTYGWRCDYYQVPGYNNIIISTGYSSLNSKNINIDYYDMAKYEAKAQKIVDKYNKQELKKYQGKNSYTNYRKDLTKLIVKMAKQAMQEQKVV
jgi:hypothetical protein